MTPVVPPPLWRTTACFGGNAAGGLNDRYRRLVFARSDGETSTLLSPSLTAGCSLLVSSVAAWWATLDSNQ